MKKISFLTGLILTIGGILIFSSCNKKNGVVTFGANYHIINTVTNVTIYVDDVKLGTLPNSTDRITDCNEASNITKELPAGTHSYKIEIRPQSGDNNVKDINGTFTLDKDECEKIFIDYRTIFGV